MPEPVVETTATTTTKATGDAALVPTNQAPAPAPAADDYIRKVVVVIDSLQFLIIVGGICGYLIYHTGSVGTDVLAVLIMVVQAEIAFILTERQYLFGGSSGSTAKNQGKP